MGGYKSKQWEMRAFSEKSGQLLFLLCEGRMLWGCEGGRKKA